MHFCLVEVILHKILKTRLNACSHSVQNILSSKLMCKIIEINKYAELWVCLYFVLLQHLASNMIGRKLVGGIWRRCRGPNKTEAMIIGWRKYHKEEVNNLHSSPNTVMILRYVWNLITVSTTVGLPTWLTGWPTDLLTN